MQIPDAIIEKAAVAIGEAFDRGAMPPWPEDFMQMASVALEAVVSDIVAARDRQILDAITKTGPLDPERDLHAVGWSNALLVAEGVIRSLPGVFGEQDEEPS